ncbi:MAG: hypothetical protein R2713_03845 [Ilumatobacteraceae bacterium]
MLDGGRGLAALLTTDQMASFVARGFLRLDAVVPPDVNAQAMDRLPHLFRSWLDEFRSATAHDDGTDGDDGDEVPAAIGHRARRRVRARVGVRADGACPGRGRRHRVAGGPQAGGRSPLRAHQVRRRPARAGPPHGRDRRHRAGVRHPAVLVPPRCRTP